MREIEYALDTLKADGIALWTDTGDTWPGNKMYAPIFDELNRRKAVVFFHPNVPKCCHNLDPGVPDSMNEYDFDITRAVTSLLVSKTYLRCPDIRFIIPHSGGTVPMLAGRIKDRVPKDQKDTVYGQLRGLYYDIAHAAFPFPLAALMKLVPTDHILFGADFPLEPYTSTTDELPAANLSREVAHAIDRGNAERLFPRLKA